MNIPGLEVTYLLSAFYNERGSCHQVRGGDIVGEKLTRRLWLRDAMPRARNQDKNKGYLHQNLHCTKKVMSSFD